MNIITHNQNKMNITLICASHNNKILDRLLLRSNCVEKCKTIVMKDFKKVTRAYNRSLNHLTDEDDILVFVHHDVYFPNGWIERLEKIIKSIEYNIGNKWGVLGLIGTNLVNGKQDFKGDLTTINPDTLKIGEIGYINDLEYGKIKAYTQIETLDELCLIVKKKTLLENNIRFDEKIPGNHFYGADLCFKMEEKGLLNFAIYNRAYHEGGTNIEALHGEYSKEFKKCVKYITNKYKFGFCTTCMIKK